MNFFKNTKNLVLEFNLQIKFSAIKNINNKFKQLNHQYIYIKKTTKLL